MKDYPPYLDYPKKRKPQANADRLISKTPQMLQKILDSLPENSPLVPYIKDGGDLALVCVFLALLLMPPDNMARIANEMMEESGFIMPDKMVNADGTPYTGEVDNG